MDMKSFTHVDCVYNLLMYEKRPLSCCVDQISCIFYDDMFKDKNNQKQRATIEMYNQILEIVKRNKWVFKYPPDCMNTSQKKFKIIQDINSMSGYFNDVTYLIERIDDKSSNVMTIAYPDDDEQSELQKIKSEYAKI